MNTTRTPEREQLAQTQLVRSKIQAAEAEIDRGEYVEYDETTLRELAKGIRDRGLERLAAEREVRG